MDTNVMYCAEQINIPTELGAIMKHYTKALILSQPKEIYKWSTNYFAKLAMMPPVFGPNGEYLDAAGNPIPKAKSPAPAASNSIHPTPAVVNKPAELTHPDVHLGAPETAHSPSSAASPTISENAEMQAEQTTELVAQIFTDYNTESGFVSKDDLLRLFGDLSSKLGMHIDTETQAQYMQYLTPDDAGKYNLQDVYALFFQNDSGQEESAGEAIDEMEDRNE